MTPTLPQSPEDTAVKHQVSCLHLGLRALSRAGLYRGHSQAARDSTRVWLLQSAAMASDPGLCLLGGAAADPDAPCPGMCPEHGAF